MAKNPNIKFFPADDEGYTLYPETLYSLFKQKNWEKLSGLFLQVYAISREQQTYQPWCNTNYLAKRTGWSVSVVRKYIKKLVELGYLIELRPQGKNGQFGKKYYQLKHLPNSATRNKNKKSPCDGFCQVVENDPLNAYRTLKGNNKVLIDSTVSPLRVKRNSLPIEKNISKIDPKHPKNKIYLSLAKKLYSALVHQKKLNPKTNLDKIAKELRLLAERDLPAMGYAKKEAITQVSACFMIYFDHIGERYWPQIYGASNIREKFPKLIAAVERLNESKTPRESNALVSDKDKYDI